MEETPVTEDEVRRATRLLEAILADPGVLATVPRDARQALLAAAGRVARPDASEKLRLARAFRSRRRRTEAERDRIARDRAGIRAAREAPVFEPPPQLEGPPSEAGTGRRLERPQDCYVCKAPFQDLHHFYDALCIPCAELNYRKRFQTAPLAGRVAMITGARVKIGYQCALKVLRAGARTVVTTRFPRDAARRFAAEPDHAGWAHRLEIHGLDLRHTPSVELFARAMARNLDRLDILINNACQTVRRPPGFYRHLLEVEEGPLAELPELARHWLARHEQLKAAAAPAIEGSPGEGALPTSAEDLWHAGSAVGLTHPARLALVPYAYGEAAEAPGVFPHGARDADLQQVDLRTRNSWRLTLGEVPTPELLEVHLVNAVAPFVLCARLKSLMARDRTGEKHVVNVSAMEGKFTRGTKTDRHPHTNMAKAALNMLTLTSAPDYLRDGVHLNAVDTGWVTDEDPAHHAQRKKEELGFAPPLDIVDGAARVCDPFFAGLLSGDHPWGKFFKDYAPTDW